MSAKHTPGPWCIGDSNLPVSQFAVLQSEPTRRHSTICRMAIGEPGAGEIMANARLMAAAPDLLAALREMVAGDADAILEADAIGIPFPDEMLAAYRKAVAAIAKATGASS